jgi:hypothetical protein
MKIKFYSMLVVLLLVAAVNVSNAQFRLGIKGGYNGATLAGLKDQQGIKDVKTLSGYHAGLYGELKLSFLSVQAEAIYSAQGAKVVDNTDTEYKVENNYVNIPVVAKVHLGPIFVLGGLQYGILTSSKIAGVKDDSGTFYKKSDMAIPVGVGVEIKKLTLEGRMNIGISNVNNVSDTESLANTVLQLSAGWRFGKD